MEITKSVNVGMTRVHLKILVVDDNQANLDLLNAVLTKAGHIVTLAKKGEEAIQYYQEQQPDMVLMDVMMPGMGGLEATRQIRAIKTDRWVPIVFVSALSHRDDMLLGLEAGGDDYLGKPIDVALLLAKIAAMQRIAVLEYKLRVSNLKLQSYRDKSERDLEMARELIAQMVQGASVSLDNVSLWVKPAENLGGDLLITQKLKQEKEYVMLADAMGHGLPATFPLVPLVQCFSGMAKSGHSVSEIAKEMNRRLVSLLSIGNFVAVTLVSWDRDKKELEIWNGGNPAALLVNGKGQITRKFESKNLALGIQRGENFEATAERFNWDGECCLAIFSDGVADATNSAGEEFGEAAIVEALHHSDPHLSLKEAVLRHIDGSDAVDDISLATIRLI